jgi:GMP synthase (glutamine-hydrolysing)
MRAEERALMTPQLAVKRPDVSGLRVTVLQIRDDPTAERQEQDCFVRRSGLAADRFRFLNLLRVPVPSRRELAEGDVLVLGGAGAHSVTEPHPFTAPLADLVRGWIEEGRPLLGSCFGHQFVAQALGGEVIVDADHAEIGTFDLDLTPAGRRDPLFAGLPGSFPVQLGHRDRVRRLPPGAIELAATSTCPNQCFRISGRPVWGCQFHVEMDDRAVLERAALYRGTYAPGADGIDRLAARLRPSPEAAGLLPRFLELAAAGDERP